MWIYIEHRSSSPTHLFGLTSSDSRSGEYTVVALVLQPDGALAVLPTSRKSADAVDMSNPFSLPGSMIQRGRWTHLGVVWAPGEAGLSTYLIYAN
jgi:hypothetical protein